MWDPGAWRGGAFWPVHPAASAFEARRDWPSVEDYDAILGPLAGVRFVEQPPIPRRRRRVEGVRRSYDAQICEDGVVPSRARSWHDFFNALVWAAYPRAKRALHWRQYRARAEGRGRRTREEDALALLDEGGVLLLCARDAAGLLQRALEARDDDAIQAAAERGALAGAVFGHAIFEHLARDAPTVRGVVHVVPCDRGLPECCAVADEALARALADGAFTDPTSLGSVPAVAPVLQAAKNGSGARPSLCE